ncbi:hypothetical protein [Salinigranum salinum]|uniref:hypothetical protein n=1 Tax=Salinigranum salinum TaxID=1364937 RepID=UPI0012604378|nr:hypothetical protein [Salinigranum salinum]
MTGDPLRLVQRGALERALVDDVDARRYFALAGTLDVARREARTLDGGDHGDRPATIEVDVDHGSRLAAIEADADADDPSAAVLPAALLSLAAVSIYNEGARPASASVDPWLPGTDTTRSAVRRGARLALRWFDVSTEHVAARAGLPAVVLAASDD